MWTPSLDSLSEALQSVWRTRLYRWLTAVLAVQLAICTWYILNHPYPGTLGGLYFEMTHQIQQHGYGYPARIPHYTANGLPMAFPPLGFYILGILNDLTGLPKLTLGKFLPSLWILIGSGVLFVAATEYRGNPVFGALVSVGVFSNKFVLEYLIRVEGITRALGFLFVIAGFFTAIRLYRDTDRRYILPGGILFGLAILSHPAPALIFGLSYVALWIGWDRSLRGLAWGCAVAAIGLLASLPYWGTVLSYHGLTPYFAAFPSGGSLLAIETLKFYIFSLPQQSWVVLGPYILIWAAFAVAGFAYAVATRRIAIVLWFGALLLASPTPPYAYLFVGFFAALFLYDVAVPLGGSVVEWVEPQQLAVAGTILVLVAGASTGAYAVSTESVMVNNHVIENMEYTQTNTPEDATFVTNFWANDWFPYYADRTQLLSAFGTEWVPGNARSLHEKWVMKLGDCRTASCYDQVLNNAEVQPDYLFISNQLCVDVGDCRGYRETIQNLRTSSKYTIVHKTEGTLLIDIHY